MPHSLVSNASQCSIHPDSSPPTFYQAVEVESLHSKGIDDSNKFSRWKEVPPGSVRNW